MGCFLGCFGSSREKKCRKQRSAILPRDQGNGIQKPAAAAGLERKDHRQPEIIASNPQLLQYRDKPGETLNLSSRKKVTFDSNVTTYDHVSDTEIEDHSRVVDAAKSAQSHSPASDDGSVISSLGSCPPNHRYRNCRDSDDEVEEESGGEDESDLEEEDEEDEEYTDSMDDPLMVNRMRKEEISDSVIPAIHGQNQNARDRSAYVYSVLNPIENVSQWKAVKAASRKKEAPPPLPPPLKENVFVSNQEQPRISFSLEPPFQDSSPFIFRGKSDRPKGRRGPHADEIAVDTSLSNWLESPSSPTGAIKKNPPPSVDLEKSRASHSSNSAISFEDRPILGALTVEELRQFSASASPRRSPSRSPDEMPIIGSVGSYWGNRDETEESSSLSVSSYKGIPNTTSKYREDKRVNWYSTPFETRLERALNRGDASSCCN